MRSPLRPALALSLVLVTGVLAAGCGEKQEDLSPHGAQQLDLVLDFYVNPDHAGIFTAQDRGYFERAGLDVATQVPSDPAAPIKEVAAGRADLAVTYEPEVLLAREQGLDVVAVASLVDEPLTSLISLPDAKIGGDPASLRGKTIATAGIPYQSDYLETILAANDLSGSDVQEVNVGFNLLPALLGGRADAILGGFRNIEGVDLAERGEAPRVVPVDELGVPAYDELVLVAQGDRVESDPKSIELFLSALALGTEDAIKDPAAATKSILDEGKGLDPKLTAAEVEATLPLLAMSKGESFGYIDRSEWESFAGWMADHGLIESIPDLGDVLTNELLPPARG